MTTRKNSSPRKIHSKWHWRRKGSGPGEETAARESQVPGVARTYLPSVPTSCLLFQPLAQPPLPSPRRLSYAAIKCNVVTPRATPWGNVSISMPYQPVNYSSCHPHLSTQSCSSAGKTWKDEGTSHPWKGARTPYPGVTVQHSGTGTEEGDPGSQAPRGPPVHLSPSLALSGLHAGTGIGQVPSYTSFGPSLPIA